MRCNWNRVFVVLISAVSLAPVGCASLESLAGGPATDRVAKIDAGESLDARLTRARTHERQGDWDKAAKIYDDLLEKHAGDWRVQHRAAVAADNQKRFKLAQQRYTKAIQLNPKNAELLNDLGYCFYLQGQLEKAESAMAKAVGLESDNSRFRNNYGMVLGQQGRIDEAFQQFAQAGSEADAFYNVAFIYASNDNDEGAMHCFQMALEADPTHEQAQSALASFARDDRGESIGPSTSRLVRYEEGGGEDGVAPADYEGAMPANRDASKATRQLHNRARTMLDGRFSSKRNAAQARNAGE